MRYLKYLIVVTVLAGVPATAWAQQSVVEVSPYVGWRHGNDISDVSGVSVDLDSGTAFGFMVDVRVTNNVLWSSSTATAEPPGRCSCPPACPSRVR